VGQGGYGLHLNGVALLQGAVQDAGGVQNLGWVCGRGGGGGGAGVFEAGEWPQGMGQESREQEI
jgi:hypothetical protein